MAKLKNARKMFGWEFLNRFRFVRLRSFPFEIVLTVKELHAKVGGRSSIEIRYAAE